MIWLQKDLRMPLFNREYKIKALYERMVDSRWQCIMILHQTQGALRIISRSQYWLIVWKTSLCETNLGLVTETSKKKKKKILKQQERVNLRAGTALKTYFWLWAVVFTGQVFKAGLCCCLCPVCRWSSAHNTVLGFAFLPLVWSGCSCFPCSEFMWLKTKVCHLAPRTYRCMACSVCKITSM